MPSHNHEVTDPKHSHQQGNVTPAVLSYPNQSGSPYQSPGAGVSTPQNTYDAATGISIQNAEKNVETRPYNYGVNWILKL